MLAAIPPLPAVLARRRAVRFRVLLRGDVEQLIVADGRATLASCRLLPPGAIRQRGGLEADACFDTAPLGELRHRLVELSRVRIASGGASRTARDALWDALGHYLVERRLDYLFTAVPVRLEPTGRAAGALWRAIEGLDRSPEDARVVPRQPLPFGCSAARTSPAPPEIVELVRRGAWLCGDAAWDRRADIALVPFLLPLVRMRTPRLRAFLARAA